MLLLAAEKRSARSRLIQIEKDGIPAMVYIKKEKDLHCIPLCCVTLPFCLSIYLDFGFFPETVFSLLSIVNPL